MNKLIILVFVISSCNQKSSIENKTCVEYNILYNNCISMYYHDGNNAHLDSALIYIDEAILNCNNSKKLFSLRKLSVYSIRKEYDKAISFIDKLDDDFNNDLPYFKKLLKYRFMAMQYDFVNDLTNRDSCLKIALNDIDSFLLDNKTKMDSLLALTDLNAIMSNKLSTSFVQYYYYKSIIYGIDNTKKEIREMQIKTKGNEKYFDYVEICLDEDFLLFIGI